MVEYLPQAPVSRLIKEAGATKVSSGLTKRIAKEMERFGIKLAKKAIIVAKFRGDIIVRASHLDKANEVEKLQRET